MIEIAAGAVRAVVVDEAGGRLGSLVVDGTELLVTSTPDDLGPLWGAFPMAPWVGRLGGGRFTFAGVEHQLPRNLPPHAIHGTTATRPWAVTDVTGTSARLTCPLGADWPFGGRAEQHVELTTDALRCSLAVVAEDRAMPVELGWHVWFASSGPVQVVATAMYERGPDHLPTGRLVAPAAPPWDDCFLTTAPVTLPVGPLAIAVTSDCDHVVVFDELALGTAVEPQSGPPDAVHVRPRAIPPGGELRRTMTIAWQPVVPPVG